MLALIRVPYDWFEDGIQLSVHKMEKDDVLEIREGLTVMVEGDQISVEAGTCFAAGAKIPRQESTGTIVDRMLIAAGGFGEIIVITGDSPANRAQKIADGFSGDRSEFLRSLGHRHR